jgi:hypothetical protein
MIKGIAVEHIASLSSVSVVIFIHVTVLVPFLKN